MDKLASFLSSQRQDGFVHETGHPKSVYHIFPIHRHSNFACFTGIPQFRAGPNRLLLAIYVYVYLMTSVLYIYIIIHIYVCISKICTAYIYMICVCICIYICIYHDNRIPKSYRMVMITNRPLSTQEFPKSLKVKITVCLEA